jgi:hypothetical protein
VMHSARMPRRGFITGRVEVDHSGHNAIGEARRDKTPPQK